MEENSTVVLPELQHNLKHILIVAKKVLLEHIPYTEQHLLRLEKQGQFARRLPLGPNRVGWRTSPRARSRVRLIKAT